MAVLLGKAAGEKGSQGERDRSSRVGRMARAALLPLLPTGTLQVGVDTVSRMSRALSMPLTEEGGEAGRFGRLGTGRNGRRGIVAEQGIRRKSAYRESVLDGEGPHNKGMIVPVKGIAPQNRIAAASPDGGAYAAASAFFRLGLGPPKDAPASAAAGIDRAGKAGVGKCD